MMNANYMRLISSMNRTVPFANTYSLAFDGVDEYLIGSTITELSNVGAFSTSMWITKPVTGAVDIIFRQQVNASNTINLLWRGAAGAHGTDYLQLQLTNGGSGNYEYTAQSIFSVGWNHLVAVYDGSLTNANRIKIYLNGSVLSTTTVGTIPTTSATYTSENFEVGGQSGGGNSINANIDEFRIYDYALTSGNITSIYNSGSPKADDLSTLAVHKYRVDDSTYPTIEDSGTGTATALTMSNMESGDIDADVP